MLSGVMLLWFLLTVPSVLFVAIDIRRTPESPVLKWAFVLVTVYTGPIGAFLYVLGCREPLAELHERYVAARWRRVLGSTMHCVAGDGIGILAGAVIASFLASSRLTDIAIEYALGFGFGWSIFQALFMRDMAGGSYRSALASTFIPEFVSMNLLMSGMVPIAALGRTLISVPLSPLAPDFWFVMSMALLTGFIVAYPINWWLVARGLKHGMMTVRRPEIAAKQIPIRKPDAPGSAGDDGPKPSAGVPNQDGKRPPPSTAEVLGVAIVSIAIFAAAIWTALNVEPISLAARALFRS
jgi:hypothetical protein